MKKQVETRTFYFYNLKYEIIIFLLFIDKYIQNKYNIDIKLNKIKKENVLWKENGKLS